MRRRLERGTLKGLASCWFAAYIWLLGVASGGKGEELKSRALTWRAGHRLVQAAPWLHNVTCLCSLCLIVSSEPKQVRLQASVNALLQERTETPPNHEQPFPWNPLVGPFGKQRGSSTDWAHLHYLRDQPILSFRVLLTQGDVAPSWPLLLLAAAAPQNADASAGRAACCVSGPQAQLHSCAEAYM